jgi:hypothetical protein
VRPVRQALATAFPAAQGALWATDAQRIGVKPLLRRVWAPMGHRPVATVQQRFAGRSRVGCVHPASGRTVFHRATTGSIPVFDGELAEFVRQLGAGPAKPIVLGLDRAGGHTSRKLRVPDHVPLLLLPPSSPEVQPAEHLCPLTNAALVTQHFASIEALEDAPFARCAALQRQHKRIRSTTLFHGWPKQIHKRRGPRRT